MEQRVSDVENAVTALRMEVSGMKTAADNVFEKFQNDVGKAFKSIEDMDQRLRMEIDNQMKYRDQHHEETTKSLHEANATVMQAMQDMSDQTVQQVSSIDADIRLMKQDILSKVQQMESMMKQMQSNQADMYSKLGGTPGVSTTAPHSGYSGKLLRTAFGKI